MIKKLAAYAGRGILYGGASEKSAWEGGAFCSCYVGVKMDKDFINQGYMTEAEKAVIAYAFDVLGLHRIEANVMPRNKCSMRLAEKCSFQYEGLSEKYLKINGVWEDHVHMVIRNHKMEM